jgi:FKBP-type peptidyl-prolyl cis-trans isomerase SlyD
VIRDKPCQRLCPILTTLRPLSLNVYHVKVKKNRIVVLDYKLNKDDAKGELIEETFGSEPLKFLYGAGKMIPSFEENIEGLSTGEKTSFSIPSDQAYGEYRQEALVDFPIEKFLQNDLTRDDLHLGKQVNMQDQEGRVFTGVIKSVSIQEVKVDFNHPMAGQDLFFSVEIKEVREATEGELDHGHAH